MPFGLFKKKWEKVACTFTLQEYGVTGPKGWEDITAPVGSAISKGAASEFFKPGCHYRLIARSIEGESAGQWVGTVWEHYEPHKGLKAKGVAVKQKGPVKAKDPADMMEAYAEQVEHVLNPLLKMNEVFAQIREQLVPQPSEGGPPPSPEGQGAYTIPAPEFEGKLPAVMHPYVIHVIAEEVKGVVEYAATRLEKSFGGGGLPAAEEGEEEEEEFLPSMSKFREQPEEEGEVVAEEEEEALLPSITSEVPEEPETVPTLITEEEEKTSIVDRVRPLWVENPEISVQEVCEKLGLPFIKHSGYIRKLLSEFRTGKRDQEPSEEEKSKEGVVEGGEEGFTEGETRLLPAQAQEEEE